MSDFLSSVSKKPMQIKKGILSCAKQVESPNFNQRPEGESIKLLVIHNISLPEGCFGNHCVESFFQNTLDISQDPSLEVIQGLQVSAHLFINRKGAVTQFVNFEERAWHAGVSNFEGWDNCNDFSIGIELEGTDYQPFEEVQYEVLAQVSKVLQNTYPLIIPASTVGHSDIAPGRKTDPGPFFDWEKYKMLWDS